MIMNHQETKLDVVQQLVKSLTELKDCEESLLSYSRNVVRDDGGLDEFIESKVGKLFGLAVTYRKVLERHEVKTKQEFEKLLQRNFRHTEIQDLVDEVHTLEKDWDLFLQGIDKNLDVDTGHVGKLEEDGPLDVEVVNAKTNDKKELNSQGATVVVISFGCKEGAEKWLEETKCKYPMLLDPERKVYSFFGLKKSVYKVWSVSSLLYYAEKIAQGIQLPKPYEDMHDDPHQMGGDFIIDKNGKIKFMHPSQAARDRPTVEKLCAELKELK